MSSEEVKQEEVKEEESESLSDSEIAGILSDLMNVYETVHTMDEKIMPAYKARQVRSWRRKLWRSIDFYVDLLSVGGDEKKEDEEE